MSRVSLRDIGEWGLVVHETVAGGSTYCYVREEEWLRSCWVAQPSPDHPVKKAVDFGAVMTALDDMVFVDLDRIRSPGGSAPAGQGGSPGEAAKSLQPGKSIVFKRGNEFYQMPESLWRKQPLDEAHAGDAKVVVKRGALVAAIPQNDIPSGTYCVLVDLSRLVP